MPNEHFCLKWNNFQKNIVAALGNLKLDEDFVDVTISCEGRNIKAHKVILSACSDYFRDVFRENPCNHPIVILRDANFTDVEGLVRYVYRGEVDVQPEHLQSFLRTAELLKIKGLADQNISRTVAQNELLMQMPEKTGQETTNSKIVSEPLRVPVPPSSHLKRTSHSSTYQAAAESSCDLLVEGKRRKTTPVRRFDSPFALANDQTGNTTNDADKPLLELGSYQQEDKKIGESGNCRSSPVALLPIEANKEASPETGSSVAQHINQNGPTLKVKVAAQNIVPENVEGTPSEVSNGSTTTSEDKVSDTTDCKQTKVRKKKKKKVEDKRDQSLLDGGDVSPAAKAEKSSQQQQQDQHPRNRWRCMQPRLCNYCWKTFSNSFNLKQHIVNVHIQSQGVTCSLCEKVVKNKWYLRKHLVTAHGAPLKRVKSKENDHFEEEEEEEEDSKETTTTRFSHETTA